MSAILRRLQGELHDGTDNVALGRTQRLHSLGTAAVTLLHNQLDILLIKSTGINLLILLGGSRAGSTLGRGSLGSTLVLHTLVGEGGGLHGRVLHLGLTKDNVAVANFVDLRGIDGKDHLLNETNIRKYYGYVLAALKGDTLNALNGLPSELGEDLTGLLLIAVGNVSKGLAVMIAVLTMHVLLILGFTLHIGTSGSELLVLGKLLLEFNSHGFGSLIKGFPWRPLVAIPIFPPFSVIMLRGVQRESSSTG